MEKKNKFHTVKDIMFINDALVITIDGEKNTFPLKNISKRLLKASKLEREQFTVDPYGYGIRWHLIDEDLSIDGLLGIKHHPRYKVEKAAV